jgi:two-component system, LytTR family, response regulator LytT
MKCLIIDRDKKSRTALEKLLKESTQIAELYVCSNPQQALDVAMEHEIDIVFANFPKLGSNGIGFIADLPYARPLLVVTSDTKDVAQDAFDHEAIDFLLKPIKNARLMKTIARAIKHDDKKQAKIRNYDNLFIKHDGNLEKVSAKDIYMMEASSDYIKIYTEKKEYMVFTTFKRLMENLSAKDFMRIHRSYIVRIDYITSIEENMVKVGRHLIPVSLTYRQALLDRLKIL